MSEAQNHTARITTAAANLQAAEAGLKNAVAGAYAAGCTWAEIGHMLGISKQTAYNRFSGSTTAAISAAGEVPAPAATAAPAAQKPRKTTSKKVDTPAPAVEPLTMWTPDLAQEDYIDTRPRHTFTTKQPATAQPGTGKGPHQCPKCHSHNHKTADKQTMSFWPECSPTKYDPQNITDYMSTYTQN